MFFDIGNKRNYIIGQLVDNFQMLIKKIYIIEQLVENFQLLNNVLEILIVNMFSVLKFR